MRADRGRAIGAVQGAEARALLRSRDLGAEQSNGLTHPTKKTRRKDVIEPLHSLLGVLRAAPGR